MPMTSSKRDDGQRGPADAGVPEVAHGLRLHLVQHQHQQPAAAAPTTQACSLPCAVSARDLAFHLQAAAYRVRGALERFGQAAAGFAGDAHRRHHQRGGLASACGAPGCSGFARASRRGAARAASARIPAPAAAGASADQLLHRRRPGRRRRAGRRPASSARRAAAASNWRRRRLRIHAYSSARQQGQARRTPAAPAPALPVSEPGEQRAEHHHGDVGDEQPAPDRRRGRTRGPGSGCAR